MRSWTILLRAVLSTLRLRRNEPSWTQHHLSIAIVLQRGWKVNGLYVLEKEAEMPWGMGKNGD
jgi:hypothetical protein